MAAELTGTGAQFVLADGDAALAALDATWDELAERSATPFLTSAWLRPWWAAFGRGTPVAALLRNREGRLIAGALVRRAPAGRMVATANVHSGDWDAVSMDEAARAALWRQLARAAPAQLELRALRESFAVATAALADAGYRTTSWAEAQSPWIELSGDFDAFLATRSAGLRQQWRRRRRALERQGRLEFRVTTGGPRLDADLDALLRLEASGWKYRAGSAIMSNARTVRLYRSFAHALAERGWLRLAVLELDGRPIAADLGTALGGTGHLIKTGFDEDAAAFSPGLVLRGQVLRAAIEEGLRDYDLLGGPDAYKLRWTDQVRPRAGVAAGRGVRGIPVIAYRSRLRPALVRARRFMHSAAAAATGGPRT